MWRRKVEEILKPTVHGWGINDIPSTERCPFYAKWRGMIVRGYSEALKQKRPTYRGVYINDEWKYLSAFKDWMQHQLWEGLQLDKDILVIGNKEYGSKTCCFVPQYINKLLNINQNNTGKVLPLGVCIKVRTACAVNIYVAQCRVDGDKGRHIGRFPSAMLAHAAWQLAKANAIKCAVIKYRLEPSYRKDVEDALQLRAEMLQDDHANHRETFSL